MTQIQGDKLNDGVDGGAMPGGPRSHPAGLSLLRVSAAVAVSIAIAGCASPEQRAANERASELAQAKFWAERNFAETYQTCINRVTGAFSSASLDVMKECERQACMAIGTEPEVNQPLQCIARRIEAGTAETAQQVRAEGREPDPKGRAQ